MNSIILESMTFEMRSGVFSALGDPIRLLILDKLTSGEKCVCDLQETVGVAPNLLSYHLRVLREANLVETSRRGRWVDYRIAPTARLLIQQALPAELTGEAGS
jgi:ArsR family transcriptional regulator